MDPYRVDSLDSYDLVTCNETEFKAPCGACHKGNDTELFLYFFPEERTLNDFDEFFSNKQNITQIQITNPTKSSIYETFRGFCYLESLGKEKDGAYHDGYDEDGNYYKLSSDLIKILLRRERPDDKIDKMQSDMEYIAIMADIDIDDDIYKE